MIVSIIIIGLAFIWLGYETDWLTVRLLVGAQAKPERYYSRSEVHELCKRIGWTFRPYKGAHHWEALAKEWLTPLCGWDWVFAHEHDLDNYQPHILLRINGNRYAMTVRKLDILKEVIKVNTVRHNPKRLAQLSHRNPDRYAPNGREWWQAWQDALIPLEEALKTI